MDGWVQGTSIDCTKLLVLVLYGVRRSVSVCLSVCVVRLAVRQAFRLVASFRLSLALLDFAFARCERTFSTRFNYFAPCSKLWTIYPFRLWILLGSHTHKHTHKSVVCMTICYFLLLSLSVCVCVLTSQCQSGE
jgi:hypothetical protein